MHNLIVCTLCSCYPLSILGLSPPWYKSRVFRARAVREPRRLLSQEFGLAIPDDVAVRVHDSTADLDRPPAATGRDRGRSSAPPSSRGTLIGTAVCVLRNEQPKTKRLSDEQPEQEDRYSTTGRDARSAVDGVEEAFVLNAPPVPAGWRGDAGYSTPFGGIVTRAPPSRGLNAFSSDETRPNDLGRFQGFR